VRAGLLGADGRAVNAPSRRRWSYRCWAAALAFMALSAHLLLPLVVTCRTYRSLTLNAPPPCCAGKMACHAAGPGPAPETLRKDGVDCPFCKAASPFRHANPSTVFVLAAHSVPLVETASSTPVSVLLAEPDLTAASPRAPPSFSA